MPELLGAEEPENVHRLGVELREVREADTTPNRDRKRLLRTLIEEVQLRTAEAYYAVRIVLNEVERVIRAHSQDAPMESDTGGVVSVHGVGSDSRLLALGIWTQNAVQMLPKSPRFRTG